MIASVQSAQGLLYSGLPKEQIEIAPQEVV